MFLYGATRPLLCARDRVQPPLVHYVFIGDSSVLCAVKFGRVLFEIFAFDFFPFFRCYVERAAPWNLREFLGGGGLNAKF